MPMEPIVLRALTTLYLGIDTSHRVAWHPNTDPNTEQWTGGSGERDHRNAWAAGSDFRAANAPAEQGVCALAELVAGQARDPSGPGQDAVCDLVGDVCRHSLRARKRYGPQAIDDRCTELLPAYGGRADRSTCSTLRHRRVDAHRSPSRAQGVIVGFYDGRETEVRRLDA